MYSVGIDLGTTNTVVSTARRNISGGLDITVEKIEQFGEDGYSIVSDTLLPSVLYTNSKGEHFVGKYAKKMRSQMPKNCIACSKNYMGMDYKWNIGGSEYTPELVASSYLSIVKKYLDDRYKDEERSVVVTVPASFDIDQRNATKKAMKLAGFEDDITLISEPTSAILDFINYQSTLEEHLIKLDTYKNILVFDIGGGTCDVAILKTKINGGSIDLTELAVSPHTLLGGSTFDSYVVTGILNDFEKQNKIKLKEKLSKDEYSILVNTLLTRVEERKIYFTSRHKFSDNKESDISSKIIVPNLSIEFEYNLTMSKMNEYVTALFDKNSDENIIQPIDEALNSIHMSKEDIDYVFIVGGMSNYPLVKKKLDEYLGKESLTFLNSMEAISRGASCYPYFGVVNHNISHNNEVDITPTLPNSVYLNIGSGLPLLLIEEHTPAGSPKELDRVIKTSNATGVELELFSGRSLYDPNLKKLFNKKLVFDYGVPVGSDISLRVEYTNKGVLEFTAWLSDNPSIKLSKSLDTFDIKEDDKSIEVKGVI